MEQGQKRGQFVRKAVVVREDDIEAKGPGPQECVPGGHAVVHRDPEANALAMEPLHHGAIESIAILLAAGDGGLGPGP